MGRDVPAMYIFEKTKKKKTGDWVSDTCKKVAVSHYLIYTRIYIMYVVIL